MVTDIRSRQVKSVTLARPETSVREPTAVNRLRAMFTVVGKKPEYHHKKKNRVCFQGNALRDMYNVLQLVHNLADNFLF